MSINDYLQYKVCHRTENKPICLSSFTRLHHSTTDNNWSDNIQWNDRIFEEIRSGRRGKYDIYMFFDWWLSLRFFMFELLFTWHYWSTIFFHSHLKNSTVVFTMMALLTDSTYPHLVSFNNIELGLLSSRVHLQWKKFNCRPLYFVLFCLLYRIYYKSC